jgi:hypothetical protein
LVGLHDLGAAREHAARAYEGWSTLNDQGALQVALHSLAAILAAEGRFEDAARLLGHCATRQSQYSSVFVQSERNYVDLVRDSVSTALGTKQFDDLTAIGSALTMETAEAIVSSLFRA